MEKIICELDDKKVNSKNIQFLMDIKGYVELAENIIKNNPYQRNKVSRSNSVYSLLKEDILKGCIIPPIVLASTASLKEGGADNERLESVLRDYDSLKILDGLQRSLSLISVYRDNQEHFDSLSEKYLVRVEVYLSISETGILYRMLTLNTGQTPMTLRHQLEILFSKYSGLEFDGLKIIKEIDDESIKSIRDYRFSDLIEGYNSFLEKNELPIDRFDILQTVKTIRFISSEEAERIEFPDFVKAYHALAFEFDREFSGWSYPTEDEVGSDFRIKGAPFGKSVYRIFNRSQALTGFGAAVGDLIEANAIAGLDTVERISKELRFEEDNLLHLIKCLDDVRETSKKIGTGQRIFFRIFFKFLLDREGNTYLNISDALEKAKNRALAEI